MPNQELLSELWNPSTHARWQVALKSCPTMHDFSRRALARLMGHAEPITFDHDDVICRQGEPADGFYFVLAGTLRVLHNGIPVLTLGPARTFGVEATIEETNFPATLRAEKPGAALFFPRGKVTSILTATASRRPSKPEVDALQLAQVIRLEAPGLDLPLDALATVLAQSIAASFPRDRVLLIGAQAGALDPVRGPDGVWRSDARPDADSVAACDFDYAFLLGGSIPEYDVDQIVRVSRGACEPRAVRKPGDPAILRTVLIDPAQPPEHGLVGCPTSVLQQSDHHASCWLHLDPARATANLSPTRPLAVLDENTRAALDRWARAVTDRTVGLSLSGGGAWGFYHYVALKRLVREKKVPIDVITSASVGSAVGAYFCARGVDGLEAFKALCTRKPFNLDLVSLASIISTRSLEYVINRELGAVQLHQLSTRFHPVTTDLGTGDSVVIESGSIGLAVRASGSAPGVWGPTLVDTPQGLSRYVDGCVADNLPASVLPALGADLTMAINCFPHGLRESTPPPRSRFRKFLHEINPVARVLDLVASGSLMLHVSGDFEGAIADVYFDIGQESEPLLRSAAFMQADEFIKKAEDCVRLNKCVDELAQRWSAMVRRRPDEVVS